MDAGEIIEKEIEKFSEETIKQQIQLFNKQIKKYAQDFLNVIKKDNEILKEYTQLLKREKLTINQIQKANLQSTYEWRTLIENRKYMSKKDYYREMTSAALLFQNQINQLLDQTVQLVYVYQNNEGDPVLYTLNQKSLQAVLSYERNKTKILGRFRENEKFKSYLKEHTKMDLSDNFNIDYFNYTYKQVIWRFNYGHQKKSDLIMWLNPSSGTKWLTARVDKTGDIKEAYASVVLDRKINEKKTFNDQKLDNNVHSFMEQIAKVDNESGLLKGDVTIGRIQYAIKGVKAQTLGVQQIINLAQQIINKTTYTKQDLEKVKEDFHKKAKTRNHIEKAICSQLNQKWQKDIQKIIQEKNNVNMKILIKYNPKDLSLNDVRKLLTN